MESMLIYFFLDFIRWQFSSCNEVIVRISVVIVECSVFAVYDRMIGSRWVLTRFYTYSGVQISSLQILMPFNDFANWIQQILIEIIAHLKKIHLKMLISLKILMNITIGFNNVYSIDKIIR